LKPLAGRLPRLDARIAARAGPTVFDAVYLRAAQAYMLISMPTGTSITLGAFQVIPTSQEIWRELHADVERRTTPDIAQVRKIEHRTLAGWADSRSFSLGQDDFSLGTWSAAVVDQSHLNRHFIGTTPTRS